MKLLYGGGLDFRRVKRGVGDFGGGLVLVTRLGLKTNNPTLAGGSLSLFSRETSVCPDPPRTRQSVRTLETHPLDRPSRRDTKRRVRRE